VRQPPILTKSLSPLASRPNGLVHVVIVSFDDVPDPRIS